MRRLAFVVVALLAACDGPFEVGRPLMLANVNGQPLPWASPTDTMAHPLKITEGWVRILNGGFAERHERLERWDFASPTDSTLLQSEWTQGGPYQWSPGRIVITYPLWSPGALGPPQPVETLYVSDRGLTLRQTGFVPPLDSMIRAYCSEPSC